jgi:hypothetical protein
VEDLLVLHLLVLAAAPAAQTWSLDARRRDGPAEGPDPRYGWAVRTMALITVVSYVLAGIAKLRIGGFAWLTDEALRHHVAYDNLRKILLGDVSSPVAPHLVGRDWIFRPFALVTLLVELGAPLALLGGRIRSVWVVAAWSFHLGVLVLMAILFPYPLLGFAFAPLFRVERLATLVAPRRRGGRFANVLQT